MPLTKPDSIEYLAKVDVSKNPQMVGHPALIPITDFGIRLGFANAVMQARGMFAANALTTIAELHNPIPLLTWPFLDFLSAIDVSKIDLIELGSGNSTHVFSTMFHQVISYENNASWAETLEHHLPANVTLHRFTGETLDPQSVPVEPEHWLLVDFSGKRTRFIREFLTGKSTDILPVVVILDNSDWYRNGARLLATAGYREIPFYGMKSGQTWISCTSFFFLPARIQLASRQPFYQPEFSRSFSPEWDRVE